MAIRNPACDCGEDGICNEKLLECHPCCRCVPVRLCIEFEAEDCDCDGFTDLLIIDENNEYIGQVPCGVQVADLLIHILYEEEKCFWRVVSELLDVDERFEIGGSYGESCEEPELEVEFPFEECTGILRIRRHEHERLLPRIEYCVEEPWCNGCHCVCKVLCTAFNDGSNVVTDELEWDEETRSWGRQLYLEKSEETGDCVIRVAGFDPIPIDDCDLELKFYAQNSLGHIITGQCKECSCSEVCLGCCLPTRYEPYFGWFPADIPFSVSAPMCPGLNGHSSTFVHHPAVWEFGACGVCAIYVAPTNIQFLGQRPWAPSGICTVTPCNFYICFALECVGRDETRYVQGCCDRLRLIVGCTEPLINTVPNAPGSVLDCSHIMRLTPTSCICGEDGQISAIFDLSAVVFQCNNPIQNGPCYGQDDCCIPFDCNLEGATLVI